MHSFPHRYSVSVLGGVAGPVTVSSPDLPDLTVDSPPEFDGPGGFWSPETLLLASLVNCLALSWRSIAAHNRFDWVELTLAAEGVLDRVDRITRFTEIRVGGTLSVAAGSDADRAARLLAKAKSVCVVSNSLNATVSFDVDTRPEGA